MADLCVVSFDAEVEIRSDVPDGRTVEGIIVPYNEVTRRVGYRRAEKFVARSFDKSIAERGNRVTLHAGHPPRNNQDEKLIGRAVEYRESAAGKRASFKVAKTPLADEWLELVRDGIVTGFSVGFVEMRYRDETLPDGTVLRTQIEAGLRHVALTAIPAYDGALVEAVRSEDEEPAGLSLVEFRMARRRAERNLVNVGS